MKLKSGGDLDNTANWKLFSHSQAIDREPNLFFKPYLVKDIFRGMKSVPIKDYLKLTSPHDGDVNESRIKVLLTHSNSPSKKCQTHRQS